MRPALNTRDKDLGNKVESRFEAAEAALVPYRLGSGYVAYNRLTDTDTRKLSQAIDALAEPLAEVGAHLVASWARASANPRGAVRR